MRTDWDALIVGGGFFGCMIALHLKRKRNDRRIVILERDRALLRRASYHNQARVHNGYHYPRSPLTALRSRVNFPRFVGDFRDCVVSDFDKYYAIAGPPLSKVTARQFRLFFERMGSPIEPAPDSVRNLFDPDRIEDVFRVVEYAFDADALARRMSRELEAAGIEVRFETDAIQVEGRPGGRLVVHSRGPSGFVTEQTDQVFNCTYSGVNRLLESSGLPRVPLKHELTEMALVEVPEVLRTMGITVMCGPFFSIMPFPPRGLHTLSHVRYTPHEAWSDDQPEFRDGYAYFNGLARRSRFAHMMRDVARYMPIVQGCRHVDSLWEVKTILPASEVDDSRPILMRTHHGLPNLHCVMGGKIDNVYDALDVIDRADDSRRIA